MHTQRGSAGAVHLEQKAIWTVVPHGVVGGMARISVVVDPRIEGPKGAVARLADAPMILEWPATISGLDFVLEVQTGHYQRGGSPDFVPSSAITRVEVPS